MRFKVGSSSEGASSWVILESVAQLAQHSPNGDNLKLEHNYDYRNCQACKMMMRRRMTAMMKRKLMMRIVAVMVSVMDGEV